MRLLCYLEIVDGDQMKSPPAYSFFIFLVTILCTNSCKFSVLLLQVSLLSRIHHRNLVQFLGYCQEDGKSVLVYEFMHSGTLKEHLYGKLDLKLWP